MAQVESKMKLESPGQDIYDLFENYFNEIFNEQQHHKELFQRQQQECDDEASFRAKEVQDATSALDQANVTLDHCSSQRQRAERDLSANSEEQSKSRIYLDNLTQRRNEQAAQFELDTQSYKYNSSAIEEAIVILQEIWQGQSEFIQLTRHVNKMLKHAVSMRKVSKMAALMGAFAQLSSRQLIADEGELQNVLRLLNQFREDVENDFRAKETAENEAIREFGEQKANIEDYIARLEQAESELHDEVKELDQCINNQTAISQVANAKLRRNQDLLDSATSMCLAFANEYAAAYEGRKGEVALMNAIIDKLNARLGNFSKNIDAIALQDKFAEYVNSSPYEAVNPFVHRQAEYNPSGAEAAGYQRDQSLENLF